MFLKAESLRLRAVRLRLLLHRVLLHWLILFKRFAKAGDHIVSAKTIYGGTYNYLAHTFPEHGVKTTFVDPDNLSNFEDAIQENTKAIFFETLGNPNSNQLILKHLPRLRISIIFRSLPMQPLQHHIFFVQLIMVWISLFTVQQSLSAGMEQPLAV